MIYPSWFPYTRTWFQSLTLCLTLLPVAWISRIIGQIGGRIGLTILAIANANPDMAFIHHFFWGEPHPKLPAWMPGSKSIGEGFWGWCVAIVCVTLSIVIVIFVREHDYPYLSWNDDRFSWSHSPTDTEIMAVSWLWIILMAYCYHIRIQKSVRKKEPPTPPQNG